MQTGEIVEAIENWDAILKDRTQKLEMVWPYAVQWLEKPITRLSPVVPVYSDLAKQKLSEFGISSGYRMFERIAVDGERRIERVLPIPIHQDVSFEWLSSLLAKLDRSK